MRAVTLELKFDMPKSIRKFLLNIAIIGLLSLTPPMMAQTMSSNSEREFQVVSRGQDFAAFERVAALTNAAGQVRFETNRFTILENALHYFENGVWKESEDLIE